jgi:hypothetical protein
MPRSRYERDNELGPKQTRAFLLIFAVAAVLGLIVGVIWIIAGLINFHVLR